MTIDSASIEDSDRKKRKAANTYGAPVKFTSKLLALQVNNTFDPNGDVVFVAEANGRLSALKLSTNQVSLAGRPATAPLTSLASVASQVKGTTPTNNLDIFAGCWDKSIVKYTYQPTPGAATDYVPAGQSAFLAHTDFVKCTAIALTADGHRILASGGADSELSFWTLEGTRLATVRPNCRAIESIVLDPFSSPEAPVVFFSTSQREIFQIALPTLAEFATSRLQMSPPVVAHDTSVYQLFFDSDGDLWTASADKTAKHLSRQNNWMADTTLTHPDFVRDVVVHPQTHAVVTACRDEEIRVWNGNTSELIHVFSGHYEEVTGLAIMGDLLLSISIDATLRRWSLAPSDLQAEIQKAKNPSLLEDNPEPKNDELGMLTAEEEAELKALMEEEEADTLERMAKDEQ